MALKKPWITCPGRWECAHDQGRAQSGELPPQQAKALPPLPFPALRAPQGLEVQPVFIRGQNMGGKYSLLWEMGSSEQGSAASVSRAGSQIVTLPQGMIPQPVDALLPCPDSSA